jgi:predicted ATPase
MTLPLARPLAPARLPRSHRRAAGLLRARPALVTLTLARPVAAGERPRHNLPNELSSLVGREHDVRRAQEVLGTSRLLTLLGTGGVGKTRLARHIAAEVLADYRDGVWLVELAALAEPAAVPQAVAAVLGVREQPGRTLLDTLTDALHAQDLLLVLDNCEHLVDACATLADRLLRACSGLRILATSREALGLIGEATWQVAPLAVPDLERLPGVEELSCYPSVRLFVERAKLVAPDFALSDHNAAAVAHVCSRVDGIPLALELAAARLRCLSVAQVAERLNDGFGLLVGGSRTALPRQQTLRATLEWSVGLLSEPERLLLARLSVFAGGCSLEAAEAVCADGSGRIADVPVMDLLGRLVDKSLVMTDEDTGQERRYRLLETVRQYAAELLEAHGGRVEQQQRHRDWYLARAEQVAPH